MSHWPQFALVFGALAVAAGLAGPVLSQTASGCGDADPERSISACTFLIDGSVGTADDVAIAHYHRGNAYAARTRHELAITDYTSAIARHPRFPAAYNNRGIALAALARFTEAIGDFTEAIRLEPQQVDAHFNRGDLYAKLGELTAAVDDLTDVVRLTPNNSSAYFARGIVFIRKGDLEAGLADLRTTVKLDPGHARAQQLVRALRAELH